MSRAITAGFKTHLAGEETTLALLWEVIRKDGEVFGFTDHDQDITIGGVTYVASSGFNASAMATTAALNVDNLDVDGILAAGAITDTDILAGVWDHAEIRVYLCNWANLAQGTMKLRRGWIGQVKTGRGAFSTELRGLMQVLQQSIGEVYAPNCRADFCDARCKLVEADHTVTGTVTGVVSKRLFGCLTLSQADHFFDYGRVTWTSGLNVGLSMEVKTFLNASHSVELQLPMPFEIAIGDDFTLLAGCDRTFPTCRDRFGNVINFRGEPHLPGIDRIMLYGRNGT